MGIEEAAGGGIVVAEHANIRPRVESHRSKETGISTINIQPGTVLENNPVCEKIFKLIQFNDVSALKDVLGEQPEIDVVQMRCARKFTVLAFCCYKNNEEIFMILYQHALENNVRGMKFDSKKQTLSNWANSPTDEEFTALHFATYHGNYNVIKFLIDTADADIYKRNKFGSTVMHIAAQGD